MSPSVHRETLLSTLEQLAVLSETNLSFVQGMNVAARETDRQQGAAHGGRLYKSVILSFSILLFVMAGVLISFDFLGSGGGTFAFMIILAYPHVPSIARMRQLQVYLAMRDRMNRGLTLSETMHSLPRVFPRYSAELVAAAEKSGKLSAALRRLIDDQRHLRGITEGNYAILTYLATIVVVQFGILLFMMVKVLPVFSEVAMEFASTSQPPLTSIMFGAVNVILFYQWEIVMTVLSVAILVAVCVTAVKHDRGDRGEGILHDIISLIARPIAFCGSYCPGLRRHVAKLNLAKAAYVLENLLHVGVPLPEAMRTAANADLNPLYRDMLLRMEARINQGDTFFEALQRSRRFLPVPPSFTAFARLAESSGTLPQALGRLGAMYRTETQNFTRVLAESVLPICVLIMGGVTLVFVGGSFSMITEITNAVLNSL